MVTARKDEHIKTVHNIGTNLNLKFKLCGNGSDVSLYRTTS